MAEKHNNDNKRLAEELKQQLGVESLWQTTDGYWFTDKAKADAHAIACNVKLKNTQECSQK